MSVVSADRELRVTLHDASSNARVSLTQEGIVSASIDAKIPQTTTFTTTATECSWNVYTSAKFSKNTQVSNRAPLVELANEGQMLRVGNIILVSESVSSKFFNLKLNAPKFSLYIDSITRHGRYVFVTSRQKITTIPEPEEESKVDNVNESEDKTELNGAGTDKLTAGNTSSKSDETPKNKKAGTADPDSSDDDDNGSDEGLPKSDSEDESEENSADESWSEGSTEFDSDTRIAETVPTRPRLKRPAPELDNFQSDESDLNSASESSEDSDLDTENMVEGRNKGGRDFVFEQDRDLLQAMYVTDRAGPATDEEDEEDDKVIDFDDDYMPANMWDDYDYMGDYRNIDSDSEGCSACGDDGGVCALPSKNPTDSKSGTDEDAKTEQPIGTPLSEILVYDMSKADDKTDPKRIFHFKRPTSQILYASAPAVHPSKPLVVWPLGDGKVLFANYINNTFFVRRIFTNQFWSSHVSVNCRFSTDGKYLHVLAVEKSGQPPELPVRKSKAAKSKEDDPKSSEKKKKKDPTTYRLVVSTYRMSSRKTTKAPPRLVGRIHRELGELTALPAINWDQSRSVFITAAQREVCHIYQVDVSHFEPMKSTKNSTRRSRVMTIQCMIVTVSDWAQDRGIAFMPHATNKSEAKLVVAAETTQIPWYKPEKPAEPVVELSETKSTADSSQSQSISTIPAMKHGSKEVETNGTNIPGEHKGSDLTNPPTSHVDGHARAEDRTQSANLNSKQQQQQQSDSDKLSTISLVVETAADYSSTDVTESGSKSEISEKQKEKKEKSIHPNAMVAVLNIGNTSGDIRWLDVNEVDKNSSVPRIELEFKPLNASLDA